MSVMEKTKSGPHSRESLGTSKHQLELPPQIRWRQLTKTLFTSTLLAEDLAIS